MRCFDPRSRTGSDLIPRSHTAPSLYGFRSTLPHGERRRGSVRLHRGTLVFRSTLPHGERHRRCPACRALAIGFDPRSRTGSDAVDARLRASPLRRFDPRSRTGSDLAQRLQLHVLDGFDPRSRTGSDVRARGMRRFRSTLRTGSDRVAMPLPSRFDPRSRTGSDRCRRGPIRASCVFRSTLPHGERRALCDGSAPARVSIHAPARGATAGHAPARLTKAVSIHAPARGATPTPSTLHSCSDVSIHAPARGATPAIGVESRLIVVSIHAPARGATSRLPRPMTRLRAFRSTLPHGERPSRRRSHARSRWCFDPRSRTGSDPALKAGYQRRICVSIHAPARGATLDRLALRRSPGFDPRSRTGSDRLLFNTLKTRPKVLDLREPSPADHSSAQAPRSSNTKSLTISKSGSCAILPKFDGTLGVRAPFERRGW